MTTVPAFQSKQFSGAIQRWTKDPIAWSALGSILFHGIFFAAFPYISATGSNRADPEVKDPVDIIELTTLEQQRLPDVAADVQLPAFASALPPSSNALPPLPGGFLAPPPAATFIPSFTPPPLYQVPDSTYAPAPPAPPPRQRTDVEQPSWTPDQDAPSPNRETPQESNQQPTQPDSPPNSDDSNNPSQPSQIAQAQERAQQAREIQERRMANLKAELEQRQAALRAAYTYDANQPVTQEAGQPIYIGWSAKLGQIGIALASKDDVIPLPLSLPEIARQRLAAKAEEKFVVQVGVVIDGAGKVVTQPAELTQILQSSGYKGLDDEALQQAIAKTYDVRPSKQKAYIITVEFNR
jgi:outer membrane biosynthesis protein TonB